MDGHLSRLHSEDDGAVRWLANLGTVKPHMKEDLKFMQT